MQSRPARPGIILGLMTPSQDTFDDLRSTASCNELGDFLRSRREKLSPEALGLKNGRRRRTPGLRREEVAERAGIGVDWYIRLEQGRTVKPSSAAIDALAKALRLGKVEHAHLRALAKNPHRQAFSLEIVPETMQRMVASLNHPAYIIGRRWDLLAWNDAAADIFTDFNQIAQKDRNILLLMFTAPAMQSLFGEAWAGEAKRMLASFRTIYDLWAGDPAFIELRERLRQGCPEFESWWNSHEVGSSAGVEKLLHHPSRGSIRFGTASQANDAPSLKLAIYTPLSVRGEGRFG